MTDGFSLSFAEPLALALLALLPLAGLVALAGAAPAARRRRTIAVGLRCLVLASLVLALGGAKLTRASERLAVVFVVDGSDSVGAAGRAQAEAYVTGAIAELPPGDRAAVVLFGADAVVERAMSDRAAAGNGDCGLAAAGGHGTRPYDEPTVAAGRPPAKR